MIRSASIILALAMVTGCTPTDTGKKSDTDIKNENDCTANPDACDEDDDGYKPTEGDCDDGDASVNSGETEVCDGLDNDCDGDIDNGVMVEYYKDFDGDGFGNPADIQSSCEQPVGYTGNNTDCDDEEPRAFPGNVEVCDEIDNNCDGQVDEGVANTYYADADADGYGDPSSGVVSCEQPVGWTTDATDCDDSSDKSFPGNSEICDEIDNDCNGLVDEGVTTTYWADVDDDGYGDISLSQESCAIPTGYIGNPDDCDDTLASVYPAAPEYCNGRDDDCDTQIDEDDAVDASTWYADADGDTYGDAAVTYMSCTVPAGYVADNQDCDDARAASNPAATEYCNGYDDDCDEIVDEDSAVDASTWYLDADSDGYGNSAVSDVECSAPAGYGADATDCDDGDATSHPGGTEVCDGADNDCNGTIDDNPTDGITYYADSDSDGFGDPTNTTSECSLPSGYAENMYDCDDFDNGEPKVADVFLGSGSGTGSLARPYDQIQDAIDDAYECVVVYSGTYNEQIDLGDRSIDVWGVEGSDVTQIDAALPTCTYANPTACGAAVVIASNSGAAPTIHGFSITGGSGYQTSSTTSTTCADSSASHSGSSTCTVTTYNYCGGGIYVYGDDPVFDDLSIETNLLPVFDQHSVGSFEQYWLYSEGGGVCGLDANITMTNVVIAKNYADQGGGVYASAGSIIEIDGGNVSENDASDGGGFNISNGTAEITNAIVSCNTADTDGGGVYMESSGTADFENASFYGNTSDTSGSLRGADAWIGASTTFNLMNSIVENDIATALLYGAGTGTSSYNNIVNDSGSGSTYAGSFAAGTGDISSTSNYTRARCDGNTANDSFALVAASVSINAGNPDPAYNDVDGTRNDQGAYGGPGGSW